MSAFPLSYNIILLLDHFVYIVLTYIFIDNYLLAHKNSGPAQAIDLIV